MPPHRDSRSVVRATGSAEPSPGWDRGDAAERRQYSALGMRGGLGKTLLTAFLLLAIVPLGLLAFATYNQIQNDTRRKVLSSLEVIVALEEAHVVDWADGCERELGLLAGLCDDIPALDEACAVHAAAWLTETQAEALVLVQAGEQGRQAASDIQHGQVAAQAVQVIAGNGDVLGEGLLADGPLAALRDGIAGGGMVILPASEAEGRSDSAGTVQPLLAIGHRLPVDGRYLVVLFPWQSLQRLIGTPSSADRPDATTRVTLATRDEDFGLWIFDFGSEQGIYSRQSLEQAAGEKTTEEIVQAPPYAALGTTNDILSGSGAGLYTNLAGVPVLGAYRWNPQLQAAVVAEQPQAEVLAAGNAITALIVAITLGMALVTAAIAAVVTRQVTRPIVQLTETAARMARGDLDHALDGDLRQVAVTRQDEIGVLARAFNRMAAELGVLYADLHAKVELLTNMSHALRTPLTSIIGFSRLMLKELDGPLTDLQQTDLAAIHEGGQQLLDLINDMLELSDLELETAPITIDEVDLTTMVDGVMATGRALALNKPVELSQDVADNLPTLYTDGRRVRRVLLALVSNAVRITKEGNIRLSARAGDGQVTFQIQPIGARPASPEGDLREASGTEAEAKMSDQGPGPPSPKGDLRETCGTGNGDLARSGLGLTISQQTVEKLGGRIWVESNGGGGGQGISPAAGEGAGPVFTFSLPISPSDMH
jgi:signal transduction histidine kinase